MITVILNCYNRPHTLDAQIAAIKKQTIKVPDENIWIWFNKGEVPQPYLAKIQTKHKIFVCNHNTKFHGRFAAALLATTDHLALFDDDIIPGPKWFENCLNSIEKVNGVLGGSGVILHRDAYNPNHKVGWNGIQSDKIEQVDLVGHAWFLRTEWIRHFWSEKHASYDNGEDISLSYLCQKHGINTFVPPHPINDQSLLSFDPDLGFKHGNDKNASWLKNSNHSSLRDEICIEYIRRGWKTVKNKP